MKSTFSILALIAIGFISCGPTYVTVHDSAPRQEPLPPAPVEEEVSYQTFYDDLSPYGQWIDYPGYGYVWMPNVGYGFKPYATNGHWVYSDAGWVWASDYNWGWATFHYGRWFFDNAYGWMWVPGYEWAPAWVSWRRSNDYYGWAPLSPGISVGISISNYNPPNNYWCFVPHQYVSSPSVNNYFVSETRNVTIINNTTVINNNVTNITNNHIDNSSVNNTRRSNVYAAGPDPNEVSRETGRELRPMAITNASKPGQQFGNDHISLFRPRVKPGSVSSTNSASGNTQQRMAPARVQTLNNLRPITNNNSNISNAPANSNAQPNTDRPGNNPQFNRPANANPSVSPVNNNAPANSNAQPNTDRPVNNPQFNRPANANPSVSPVNNNAPANSNAQPNTGRPGNNPQFNRPANANPSVSPVNNNAKPNTPENLGNTNQLQNRSNPPFNRARPLQQQNPTPGQVRPQQANPQANVKLNKPPVNKDAKPKDKPKDNDHKNQQ